MHVHCVKSKDRRMVTGTKTHEQQSMVNFKQEVACCEIHHLTVFNFRRKRKYFPKNSCTQNPCDICICKYIEEGLEGNSTSYPHLH